MGMLSNYSQRLPMKVLRTLEFDCIVPIWEGLGPIFSSALLQTRIALPGKFYRNRPRCFPFRSLSQNAEERVCVHLYTPTDENK